MRIAVLHPDNSWILSTIAKRLCAAMPETFTAYGFNKIFQPISGQGYNVVMPKGVDGIYYVDIQSCWIHFVRDFPSLNHLVHVAFMTHLDHDANDSFRLGWDQLDGIIHMAQRYYDRFVEQGWYRPEQMAVIRPGEVADMPLKKIKIGVCQRGEHEGKGASFLPAVIESLDETTKAALELHFCGNGWMDDLDPKWGDRAGKSGDYHGITAINHAEGAYDEIPYKVDYLLIPSLWEGGPMSLLEALAAGVPVIAADVGWVREFMEAGDRKFGTLEEYTAGIIYEPGHIGMCAGILKTLVAERMERRDLVASMSYRRYAADVLAFFETIRGMKL